MKKSWHEKLAKDNGLTKVCEITGRRLRAEGHQIVAKGRRTLVADYEKKTISKLR